MLPSNIRELAFNFSKNYDMRSYQSYIFKITCDKILTFCNKGDILLYLKKYHSDTYIEEFVKTISGKKNEV